MIWCYTDYAPAIWVKPPLDVATHERSFGLWRADGSPKPSVDVVGAFTGLDRAENSDCSDWIDIEPDEFWGNSATHLSRLYGRYRQSDGITSR
jgi:hypothetical protein